MLVVRGGHVGAVVGSRAATELYPQMTDWFDKYLAPRASAKRVRVVSEPPAVVEAPAAKADVVDQKAAEKPTVVDTKPAATKTKTRRTTRSKKP